MRSPRHNFGFPSLIPGVLRTEHSTDALVAARAGAACLLSQLLELHQCDTPHSLGSMMPYRGKLSRGVLACQLAYGVSSALYLLIPLLWYDLVKYLDENLSSYTNMEDYPLQFVS